MKKLISIVLTIAILATSVLSFPLSVYAENEQTTVTRSQWISMLVETFSMSVEDDSAKPDNYFADITSDMECYDDILLAVEFGLVDLPVGEEFKPDDAATREFAAHTLNYSLNFRLEEGVEYTFAEAAEVAYADDIQVAINRGWFALTGDSFMPEQAVTVDEAAAMLADAKTILDNDVIDENYDSQYQFAEGVVVVPKGTIVDITEDLTVTITDYESDIKAGDVFVVFTGEIPVALVATTVSTADNTTVITATSECAENAVVSVDSQGVT